MTNDLHVRAATTSRTTIRSTAILLLLGTALYIVPSVLHGNPPIDSAEQTLRYVADRPSWRVVHLVNIAAVLCWLVALARLQPLLGAAAQPLARAANHVFTAATAVFAVYYSLHAFGLSTLADRLPDSGEVSTSLLDQTEALLVVLGSVAFTAQAMLGLSILLHGATLVRSITLPNWLGWSGIAFGGGWLTGAVLVNFAVIVPFLALTWLWTIGLAVILLRRPPHTQT